MHAHLVDNPSLNVKVVCSEILEQFRLLVENCGGLKAGMRVGMPTNVTRLPKLH